MQYQSSSHSPGLTPAASNYPHNPQNLIKPIIFFLLADAAQSSQILRLRSKTTPCITQYKIIAFENPLFQINPNRQIGFPQIKP